MNDSCQPTYRVVDIIEGTSVDGPGLRTSIYFAGCEHRCPGCHNPHTWDKTAGRDMSLSELLDIIDRAEFNVTLTGGDPLFQTTSLLPLVTAIKERGLTIWLYTGFTYESLLKQPDVAQLLPMLEAVVDGPFIEALRDTSLQFRGSANQRIIYPASFNLQNL